MHPKPPPGTRSRLFLKAFLLFAFFAVLSLLSFAVVSASLAEGAP